MVTIYGPDNLPVKVPARGRRAMALNGGHGTPYDAADTRSQHMAAWHPPLWSADAEINGGQRDRIVARVRDLVRNDGWASGAIMRIVDNAIGANFRPISKPDYRSIGRYTGNSAFDHNWAKEFGEAVDANWRSWAEDSGCWCDASRTMTFGQMMRVGFRHELIDGDALALMPWIASRRRVGQSRYATAVMLVDPDRLSNPQMNFDNVSVRSGVEVDQYGAPVAYHIRKAHQGDWWAAGDAVNWERIPRETDWGRPMVVHHFNSERAAQHRGVGVFVAIADRIKMLIKYDGSELDAAILNATFSAFVESPMDPTMVKEAMGGDGMDDDAIEFGPYQTERLEYARQNGMLLGGARIPQLFPGEKIGSVDAARPATNFAAFEGALLRNIASGLGLSFMQVSNDWSSVNYSSARAAILESWKTLSRRKDDFAAGFAMPIRSAWLDESFEIDHLPLPKGAPDFLECRAAYARCKWIGPGRGWVDPVAEKKGVILGLDAGLSTLENECAEQGLDYLEVLEQRKYELETMDRLGIPRPEWAAAVMAEQTVQEPKAQ